MLWIILIAWYLFGCFSFQYWWRKDLDLTADVIPIMLVAGIVGPLSWFIGRVIHGEPIGSNRKEPYILLKKKS